MVQKVKSRRKVTSLSCLNSCFLSIVSTPAELRTPLRDRLPRTRRAMSRAVRLCVMSIQTVQSSILGLEIDAD